MTALRELITQEEFARIWAGLCVAWTLGWLLVGGLARLRRWRPRIAPLMPACLGPIAWCLWLVYRRTIAYSPESGLAGMHKVSVLLTDLVLFAAVGVALGWAFARLHGRPSGSDVPPRGRA